MSDRDPLQSIWKNQSQEKFTMSLADIHARADKFQSRIRQRNWIEYAAAVFVIGAFVWMALSIPAPVVKTGALLIALGAAYVCWKLHEVGRAASKAERDTAQSLTAFHRAELVRQRDALKTVWRWYLAPFVPGVLVFLAGVSFAPELEAPLAAKVVTFVTGLAFQAAVFAAVWWLNATGVKRLEKEIAALDAAS